MKTIYVVAAAAGAVFAWVAVSIFRLLRDEDLEDSRELQPLLGVVYENQKKFR